MKKKEDEMQGISFGSMVSTTYACLAFPERSVVRPNANLEGVNRVTSKSFELNNFWTLSNIVFKCMFL